MLLGKLDRRQVMIALTGLLIVSGTWVAFAPNYPVFMLKRALPGIAIGGLWSMSAAVAMRLVPPKSVAFLFVGYRIDERCYGRFRSALGTAVLALGI